MQAIILAAGRGTRMKDLTASLPKPLLEVHGMTLLEHKFRVLPPEVTEIILIVGYQGDRIRERIGNDYNAVPIRYVEQAELNGTAGAVWCAAPFLTDRFIIMMGDDMYAREDIERAMATSDWSMVVSEVAHMSAGGCVMTDDAGKITEIREGQHEGAGRINTNMFVLDTRLFQEPMTPKAPGSLEYGLPQTVLATAATLGIPLTAIPASFWIQITAPEDLIYAEQTLRESHAKS